MEKVRSALDSINGNLTCLRQRPRQGKNEIHAVPVIWCLLYFLNKNVQKKYKTLSINLTVKYSVRSNALIKDINGVY